MDSNDTFKPFFGSKKTGQGFADKRKKKAAYEYLKLLKKEKLQSNDHNQPKHARLPFPHTSQKSPATGNKSHAFNVAERIARKKKEEKDKKIQEMKRVQAEKAAAMKTYKEKKKARHLKLCKKTSRGQPVMRYQMEVLLEKIQAQKSSKT